MNPIKRSFLIVAALAAGIITAASPGCVTKSTTSITTSTNAAGVVTTSTNVAVTVNQANLSLDCAGLQLVGTPALTYALQQDPGIRPILVQIQGALNLAVNSNATNVSATIQTYLGQNQSLDAQLTPLVNAAINLKAQLIAKYTTGAGAATTAGVVVQITQAILTTDLNILNSVLSANPPAVAIPAVAKPAAGK
jgi:hypothetical protein